jgi:PAS domain-containing protein
MKDNLNFIPLLEAVVSYIDEGVIIADGRGNVLYQNPAAGALLGLSGNEPIRHLNEIGKVRLRKPCSRRPSTVAKWMRQASPAAISSVSRNA